MSLKEKKRFIRPDLYLSSAQSLDAEKLRDAGIKLLLTDIDNTLVPYEVPEPPAEITELYERLSRAGIDVALVSNNGEERVRRFNGNTCFAAKSKARKPLPGSLRDLMKRCGVTPARTALLGDQIFTDILAGRLSGVGLCILVPPILDRTDAFTRFKRLLERPFTRPLRRGKKL